MQYGIAFTPLVPSLVLWIALCCATLTSEIVVDYRSANDFDIEILLQLLTSTAAVYFLLLLPK